MWRQDVDCKRHLSAISEQRRALQELESRHSDSTAKLDVLTNELRSQSSFELEANRVLKRQYEEAVVALKHAEDQLHAERERSRLQANQDAEDDAAVDMQWLEHVLLSAADCNTPQSNTNLAQSGSFRVSTTNFHATRASSVFYRTAAQAPDGGEEEHRYTVYKSSIQRLSTELLRCRRRYRLAEGVIASDQRLHVAETEGVAGLLTRQLREARLGAALSRHRAKTAVHQCEVYKAQLEHAQQKLRHIEPKSEITTLPASTTHSSSLEQARHQSEAALKQWIATELPRLVSGLPVEERALGSDASVDKSYALAHSLASAQAAVATLETNQAALVSKNIELDAQCVLLRSIIERYSQVTPLTITSTQSHKPEAEKAPTTPPGLKVRSVDESSPTLTAKITLLEEKLQSLQALYELSAGDAERARETYSHMMARTRLTLEEQHATELGLLRQKYESDLGELNTEIDLSEAHTRMHLTWNRTDNTKDHASESVERYFPNSTANLNDTQHNEAVDHNALLPPRPSSAEPMTPALKRKKRASKSAAQTSYMTKLTNRVSMTGPLTAIKKKVTGPVSEHLPSDHKPTDEFKSMRATSPVTGKGRFLYSHHYSYSATE